MRSSIRLANALEKFGVMGLEYPVPPEDIGSISQVTSATCVPIASRESQDGTYPVCSAAREWDKNRDPGRPHLRRPARNETDFPDGSYEGRFSAQHKQPIGTIAQAHLATIPNFGVLEFHARDVLIWDRPIRKKLIVDGFITLGDEPGPCLELDKKFAASTPFNGELGL